MITLENTIRELYKVFEILNYEYFDSSLELPIITIQKDKPSIYGHFMTEPIWQNKDKDYYEINLNPIGFDRDFADIVGVLLHEMVHYHNKVNGINDGKGNNHNKKFKETAERVGLVCNEDNYSNTENSDKLDEFIENVIRPQINANVFDLQLVIPIKESKPRKKTQFKYICPKCGMVAKAKAELNIVCGACKVELEMEDIENEDFE